MYRVPIPWSIVAAPGHGGVGHVCVAQETNCVPFPGFILDLSKKLWHHCLLEHSFFASFTFVIQRPIGQLGLQVWPCCITYSFSFGISSVNYNILRLCESWNAVNLLIITSYQKEMNITLPQSPQVLAHISGISSQYDLMHPLCLSSHSESIVKGFQMLKIISEIGAALFESKKIA